MVALHKCKTLKKKKLNIVALHSECTKFRALTQVRARNDNWAAPSIGTLPVDEVQMSVVQRGPQMASYHIPQVLQR